MNTSHRGGNIIVSRGNTGHLIPVGEQNSPDRDSINTVNRHRGKHQTSKRDKLDRYGPRNRRLVSLTSNGGENKHLAPLKTDKRAGQQNMENKEAKFSLLVYTNQTSIVAVTGK